MAVAMGPPNAMPIIDSRHPAFLARISDFEKWRFTYLGGDDFRNRYLERFSTRETQLEFESRRKMTPIPGFAKAAINDIRNSIFQRMRDIVRTGGSQDYQRAIAGDDMGVDRRGSTMNAFLGMRILTELLVMGRVGVFVDNTIVNGPTLAEAGDSRPYLYAYQTEDILSWTCAKPEDPSEFQALLLRDSCLNYDPKTLLPLQTYSRYRMLWIDQATGLVNLQFYNVGGMPVDRDGNPSTGPTVLELKRIPFVLLDIGDSLIKDVCQHQIALLNLVSSDVNYALKSNFPIIAIQRDMRAVGGHLKVASNPDGTATSGGQGAADTDLKVGVTQGIAYDLRTDRPDFINPSPDPLKASMGLQVKLEEDIRKLVNLAVVSLASRASAESKSMDNQGLEAGLSFIGLVLESAERRIAEFWSAYEERNPTKRVVATIKYPDRYSLKTDLDRITEATKLADLMYAVPGRTIKREISKSIVQALFGGKVDVDTLTTIATEVDGADFTTSDPKTIISASEAGLVGDKTASIALGFSDTEYKQAQQDHLDRAVRLLQAQAKVSAELGGAPVGPANTNRFGQGGGGLPGGDPAAGGGVTGASSGGDPAARGAKDLSANPGKGAAAEKAQSRDRTLQANKQQRVRGNGKFPAGNGAK